MKDNDLTEYIKSELLNNGADSVGIGDLAELPPEVRYNLPVGISVAVKYPPEVICGIAHLPTLEYKQWYDKLNERLDMLVIFGAETLQASGYQAVAQTRAQVGVGNEDSRALPHKTVATRAGLGWIGKSALLVTEQYGSMIRISSILTDAPLKIAKPVNNSKCGECMVCTNACPGRAISGKEWNANLYRDEFFNAVLCRDTARERAKQGFGGNITICGKCIEVCPYTKRAMIEDFEM